LVGHHEGHWTCKKLVVDGDSLIGDLHICIASVVITESIILSFNKLQNGDIMVLANPGPLEKMAIEIKFLCTNPHQCFDTGSCVSAGA